MTPLQIQMLLHYHCSTAPFEPWGDAQTEARREFAHLGLTRDGNGSERTSLTPRGEAYVKFLCAMPLPVQKWSMDMESFTAWLESQPRKIVEIG